MPDVNLLPMASSEVPPLSSETPFCLSAGKGGATSPSVSPAIRCRCPITKISCFKNFFPAKRLVDLRPVIVPQSRSRTKAKCFLVMESSLYHAVFCDYKLLHGKMLLRRETAAFRDVLAHETHRTESSSPTLSLAVVIKSECISRQCVCRLEKL